MVVSDMMLVILLIERVPLAFGAIQSVLISEVILVIIRAFGTNESALIREVSLSRGVLIERFPTVSTSRYVRQLYVYLAHHTMLY
jgi:hypothetical protein